MTGLLTPALVMVLTCSVLLRRVTVRIPIALSAVRSNALPAAIPAVCRGNHACVAARNMKEIPKRNLHYLDLLRLYMQCQVRYQNVTALDVGA